MYSTTTNMYRKMKGVDAVKILNYYRHPTKLDSDVLISFFRPNVAVKDLSYYKTMHVQRRVDVVPQILDKRTEMSTEMMHEKILGKNGIYLWVLENIKVKNVNMKIKSDNSDWKVVKIGMTSQDNGFLKRIAPEMKDANTLNTPDTQYDLRNIICTINGLQFCGMESMIRGSMGIPIGSGIFKIPKNIQTIENILFDNPTETIESFIFKTKCKLKVRMWSLWLTGKTSTKIGPSELILMHNDDIEKLRRIYELSHEDCVNETLVRFRGIKTTLLDDENVTLEFDTPNNPGPLIFGV